MRNIRIESVTHRNRIIACGAPVLAWILIALPVHAGLLIHSSMDDDAVNRSGIYPPPALSTAGGNYTVEDVDGDAQNGTASGTTVISSTPGLLGQALDLSGGSGNNQVSYGNVHNIGTTNSRTISVWIRPDSVSADAAVISDGNESSGFAGWLSWIRGRGDSADGLYLRAYDTSLTGYSLGQVPKARITVGAWHHIVFIIDNASGELRGYFDGSTNDTGMVSFTPARNFTSAASTRLGMRNTNNDMEFNGRMDDVAMFDEALSHGKALALYHLGTNDTGVMQYNASDVQTLFDVFDTDTPDTTSDARAWRRVTGLGGGPGQVEDLGAGNYAVQLDAAGNGVSTLTDDAPEMAIHGLGKLIVSGDSFPSADDGTSFGAVEVGNHLDRTYTITNAGTVTLVLTNPAPDYVTLSGSGHFSVIAQPATSNVPASSIAIFTVRYAPTSQGEANATVIIRNTDANEDPYTFTVAGYGAAVDEPDIAVTGKGVTIQNGDTSPGTDDGTDMGSIFVNSVLDGVFVITNTGFGTLQLTGDPVVSLSGDPSLSVLTHPAETNVAVGTGQTFTLRYDPAEEGLAQATVIIASSDPNENPYTFVVQARSFYPATEATNNVYYTRQGTLDQVNRIDNRGNNEITLLTGIDPRGIAVDPDHFKVYVAFESSGIFCVNDGGSSPESVITTVEDPNLISPYGIAVDPAAGTLYYTDMGGGAGNGAVRRANLDGSDVTELLSGLNQPKYIDLDPAGGKIYWADADGRIRRANLNGSELEVINAGDGDAAIGIALDIIRGKVYWTEMNGSRSLKRANLDGSGVETLLATCATSPQDIDVDPYAGYLVWADESGLRLRRSNLDGGNISDFRTFSHSGPTGVDTSDPLADIGERGPNGTPLYWLLQYDLTNYPTIADAELDDSDGDGMLNWEEFVAGTIPTLQVSRVEMLGIDLMTASNRIVWKGEVNEQEGTFPSLQWSTNLMERWRILGGFETSNRVGVTMNFTFTDAENAGTDRGFYRTAYDIEVSNRIFSVLGSERATQDTGNKMITWNGITHIVWQDSPSGGSYPNKVISFVHSNKTWTAPVTLNSGIDNHARTIITVDGNGYLHAISGGHNSSATHRMSVNPNDASSWGGSLTVGAGTYPVVLCDSNNTLHVNMRNATGWNGVDYWRKKSGQSWQAMGRLVNRSAGSGYAAYHNTWTLGRDGVIHLAVNFHDGATRGYHQANAYMQSRNNGDSWCRADGTPIVGAADLVEMDILENDSNPRIEAEPIPVVSFPCVSTDTNGTPHIFYVLHLNEPGEVIHAWADEAGTWHRESIDAIKRCLPKWRPLALEPGGFNISDDNVFFALFRLKSLDYPGGWIDGQPTRDLSMSMTPGMPAVWLISRDGGKTFVVEPAVPQTLSWNVQIMQMEKATGWNLMHLTHDYPDIVYGDGNYDYVVSPKNNVYFQQRK